MEVTNALSRQQNEISMNHFFKEIHYFFHPRVLVVSDGEKKSNKQKRKQKDPASWIQHARNRIQSCQSDREMVETAQAQQQPT